MTTKNTSPELEKSADKSYLLKLSLSQSTIQKKYQQIFNSFASELKLDGFRPGKVPADVAVQHLSSEKILEETFSQLASDLYSQKIKEYQLSPISNPKVVIKNPPLSLDKDWSFEIRSCEMPEIKLDSKLLDNIKKINQRFVDQKNDDKTNDHLNQILENVVKTSHVTLPEVLVEDDIEHKMSHLIDQVQQAGLTVTQYLKSKNVSLEQYQQTLKQQIVEEWTVNLAISQIAKTNKLTISDSEIDTYIKQNSHLANNRSLAIYILTQQKVFEFLKKL